MRKFIISVISFAAATILGHATPLILTDPIGIGGGGSYAFDFPDGTSFNFNGAGTEGAHSVGFNVHFTSCQGMSPSVPNYASTRYDSCETSGRAGIDGIVSQIFTVQLGGSGGLWLFDGSGNTLAYAPLIAFETVSAGNTTYLCCGQIDTQMGSIAISGPSTPEPGTFLLAGMALLLLYVKRDLISGRDHNV